MVSGSFESASERVLSVRLSLFFLNQKEEFCSFYFIVALLFLCVNGIWSNPFQFTAGQEALAELTAIVCQLLYCGTLQHEISRLKGIVEHSYHVELIRQE